MSFSHHPRSRLERRMQTRRARHHRRGRRRSAPRPLRPLNRIARRQFRQHWRRLRTASDVLLANV